MWWELNKLQCFCISVQEKDFKISYNIYHFYLDLGEKCPLFFVKIVHYFPVKRSGKFLAKYKGIFPAPPSKNTSKFRGKWGWRGGMRPIKARENKMGHLSCCLGLFPPSFIHISSGESWLSVRFRHLLPFDTVTLSAALPWGGRMCILTRIWEPNQSSSLSRRRRSLRRVFF